MFSEEEYQEIKKRIKEDSGYLSFVIANMPSVYERYKKEQVNEKRNQVIKNKIDGKYKDNKKFLDELSIANGEVSTQKEINMMNQEEYKIIKDNRLIQKATFDYTELEMKCLNYSLSKLIPNVDIIKCDEEGNSLRYWDLQFSFRELLNQLKLKDGEENYKMVRDSLFALKSKMKFVRIKRDNKITEKLFNYFVDVEVEKEKANKDINTYLVKIKFDNNVIPFIHKLKDKFTELTLIYTLRLKGKYSMRMYELCKSWQTQGEFIFYIDKARIQWCIPEKYTNGNIKQRIIDKAIKEINEKTDINISIKSIHKTNRITDWYVIKVQAQDFNDEITNYKNIENERKEFLQKQTKKEKMKDLDENRLENDIPLSDLFEN